VSPAVSAGFKTRTLTFQPATLNGVCARRCSSGRPRQPAPTIGHRFVSKCNERCLGPTEASPAEAPARIYCRPRWPKSTRPWVLRRSCRHWKPRLICPDRWTAIGLTASKIAVPENVAARPSSVNDARHASAARTVGVGCNWGGLPAKVAVWRSHARPANTEVPSMIALRQSAW